MTRSDAIRRDVVLILPQSEFEFQGFLTAIRSHPDLNLEQVSQWDLPLRLAETPPELVIVCQSTPEDYTPVEISRLLSAWPLARIVCCYAPWCESDGRTRSLWPLPVRIPVAQAIDRLHHELTVLAGDLPPLPTTASREEAFDWSLASAPAGSIESVVILSPDYAYAESLEDLLRACSSDIRRCSEPDFEMASATDSDRGVRCVLWDVDPLSEVPNDLLRSRREAIQLRFAPERVVALLGFPCEADAQRLTAVGLDAVVPKLAPTAILRQLLERAAA